MQYVLSFKVRKVVALWWSARRMIPVPRCSATVARQAIQWHQDFTRQLSPEARNLLLLVPPRKIPWMGNLGEMFPEINDDIGETITQLIHLNFAGVSHQLLEICLEFTPGYPWLSLQIALWWIAEIQKL